MNGDCEVDSNCVSSKNYPSNYGNSEECTIHVLANVQLEVASPYRIEGNGFDTITIDSLCIGCRSVSYASDFPETLSMGSEIKWRTDSSVIKEGWKVCFVPDGNNQKKISVCFLYYQ